MITFEHLLNRLEILSTMKANDQTPLCGLTVYDRKRAQRWLISASMVHVLSYAVPMGLHERGRQYYWGKVLVQELL